MLFRGARSIPISHVYAHPVMQEIHTIMQEIDTVMQEIDTGMQEIHTGMQEIDSAGTGDSPVTKA